MQQAKLDIDPKSITTEMLAALLLNIFRPETEIINQATAILKKYFELPECVTPLMKHMTSHPDLRVRLLACICVKKKIATHWAVQTPETKKGIKDALMLAYVSEQASKVRENISYAIGSLAALLVPNNEWPELFGLIMARCQSANVAEVEQGVGLLLAICESMGNGIESFLSSIVDVLQRLLAVPQPTIQKLVVKTINTITMANISAESFTKVAVLIPPMMTIVMNLQSDDSLLQEVFDNLSELVDYPKLLVPHLGLLISAGLALGSSAKHSCELRKMALMFVQTAVDTKAKIIKKDKPLLMKILETAFTIAKESEEGYEEDEETPVDAALDLLEQYALKIPNTLIYPLLMQGCETFLKSPEPASRRAALLIIGTVSKGVEDSIKNDMDSVVDVVLQCINDPNIAVQEACVIALCYFSDNLVPDIIDQHAKILPHLLDAVNSKTEKVRNRVFYALETFCEGLEEKEIIPYLKPFLQSLLGYLDNSPM